MRFRSSMMILAALLAVVAVADCWAQPPEGRGGRQGGFGRTGGGRRVGRIALLRVEAVQKELEIVDAQLGDIDKLRAELRGERGERGQRGGFDSLSEEERQARVAAMREQAQKRAKLEIEKLNDVLLPHQMKRLTEIYLQVAGASAVQDPQIAEQLKITDAQRTQLATAQREAMDKLRGQMRELFQSGDRETMRAKMTELRKEADKQLLANLSAEQQTALDDLKGEPFEMPADALRGGGGRRRGDREADRPRRPQRPSAE